MVASKKVSGSELFKRQQVARDLGRHSALKKKKPSVAPKQSSAGGFNFVNPFDVNDPRHQKGKRK